MFKYSTVEFYCQLFYYIFQKNFTVTFPQGYSQKTKIFSRCYLGKNMSHAAELLHVTQPTLSKALKGLEEVFLVRNSILIEKFRILITLLDRPS